MKNNEKIFVELPKFTGRNVKISEIAKAQEKIQIISELDYSRGFLSLGLQ